MSFSSADVYSYFECDQLAMKVAGDEAYTRDDCVGTLSVERETKTVTKSCRGVVKKRKTKPTGNGTINLKMHIKMALYRKIYAMTNEGLQPGIYAFDNWNVSFVLDNRTDFICIFYFDFSSFYL